MDIFWQSVMITGWIISIVFSTIIRVEESGVYVKNKSLSKTNYILSLIIPGYFFIWGALYYLNIAFKG